MADSSIRYSSSSAAGPGGYVTAIRAAQLGIQDRDRRDASISAASASTGAASRPRRCCARPRSITTCSTPRTTACRPRTSRSTRRRSSQRSRGVAKRLNGGVGFLMKKNKITVIWGEAKLDGAGKSRSRRRRPKRRRARSDAGSYQAKHIILATGARPRVLPGLEPDGSWSGPISRRWCRRRDAEVAAGRRLGRDRHRVRLLLPHHGRRGDGGRGAAADPAGRGRGDRGLRPQAASRSRASRS